MEIFQVKYTTFKINNMKFQAISWDLRYHNKYEIYVYGTTEKGNNVSLLLTGFRPRFYIKSNTPIHETKATFITKCQYKDIYGFSNNTLDTFYKLEFENRYDYYAVSKKKCYKDTIFESKLDPLLQYGSDNNINFTGWFEVDKTNLKATTCFYSKFQFTTHYSNLVSLDVNDVAPFLQASFDIEVFSPDNSFPDPKKEPCVIIQIAVIFKNFNGNREEKYLLSLGECNPIEDAKVYSFTDEAKLIMAFANLIKAKDPAIIYSYNGDKFDFQYISDRAELLEIDQEYLKVMSRHSQHPAFIKQEKFSSSAYGTNEYNRLYIPGRVHIDILDYVKRNFKFNSYKLDNVAENILGMRKVDLPIKQLFENFKIGTPEALTEIGSYCIFDTVLPQLISDKINLLFNVFEQGNISCVPVEYILFKGQSIKVLSKMTREAKKLDFLIPSMEYTQNTDTFQGATVLVAKSGAYFDNVSTLDFASLYPSIIMAYNMCYSTFVNNESYRGIPDVKYENVEWTETVEEETSGTCIKEMATGKRKGEVCGRDAYIGEYCKIHLSKDLKISGAKKPTKDVSYNYTFVQDTKAVLPQMCRDLGALRKHVKHLMAKETNPITKNILDARQLSIKIFMNSIYGTLSGGRIKMKEIAACVTAKGREMIKKSVRYTEDNFLDYLKAVGMNTYNGAELEQVDVIYGDSVTGDTPVVVKDPTTNMVKVMLVKDLPVTKWKSHSLFKLFGGGLEKEYCYLNLLIWSSIGWTPIKRFIRHRTSKNIYNIHYNNSIVSVTEDHSLIDSNFNQIKPKELTYSTQLLANNFKQDPTVRENKPTSGDFYNQLGLFFLYGKINTAFSWSIKLPNEKLFERAVSFYSWVYNITTLKIDQEAMTIVSIPEYFNPLVFLTNDFAMNASAVSKFIPDTLLNDSVSNKQIFLNAIERYSNSPYIHSKSKVVIQKLFYLYQCVERSVSIHHTEGYYTLKQTDDQTNQGTSLVWMDLSNNNDYVYDFETDVGNYQAGIGNVILNNTDSIFLNFKFKEGHSMSVDDLRKYIFDISEVCADNITKQVFDRPPINLEMEKIFSPLLLFTKKRYTGLKYESLDNPVIDYKGVVNKRNDRIILIKSLYDRLQHTILEDRSRNHQERIEEAFRLTKETLDNLFNGNVDIKELTLWKSIRDGYKAEPAHVKLFHRVKKENPTLELGVGDKIPYVFVVPNSKDALQEDRIEMPDTVFEKHLVLDFKYYYEHQIRQPLLDFFQVLDPDGIYSLLGYYDKL
jgi:DNA polymerase elongation subunit (family B)